MGICTSMSHSRHLDVEEKKEHPKEHINYLMQKNIIYQKMKSDENFLKIDLLEEGQNIQQFTEMVNEQQLLNDDNVVGASQNYYTKKVFNKGINNILQGFYSAYENHLPIRLTPDIIWLLIVQGFAQHVNFNSEQLRNSFVNFEGKKTLEIIIDKYHSYKQMKPQDYEMLFEKLNDQMKLYTGEELINTIDFNFSTSNKITKVVGYASIMSAMKKYFEYIGNCHMCNYPYIILEGTLNDWKNILKKAKALSKYNLKKWVKSLEPILLKIIDTKKGNIDKKFWKEILYPDKLDERIEIGVYKYKTIKVDGINGWLLLFFPYFKNGHFRYEKALKTKDIWRLPDKLLKTPLIMKSDDEGETKMTIYSGFFGMNVDKEKDNLVTAEIGWYVKEKSKNNDEDRRFPKPIFFGEFSESDDD